MTSASSGTQSGTSTDSQNPWASQAPYLLKAFQSAQDNFDKAPTSYDGQMAASRSPQLDQAMQQQLQAGNNGMGVSDMLMAAMTGGASAGAQGIGSVTDLIGKLSADPQAAIRSAEEAGMRGANSDTTTGLVDAASRDINRNLRENVLPGNNLAAGATGNMNSSRTGIADGLAKRGAVEAIADTSAAIRGDAFNRGFQSTLDQGNTNNQGILSSAGLLQQFQNAGNNAALAGNEMLLSNARATADMAGVDTADRQRVLDGDLAKFQLNSSLGNMNLQNLWSIIGGANWGGTSTNNYAGQTADNTRTNTSGQSQNKNKSSSFGFGLKL